MKIKLRQSKRSANSERRYTVFLRINFYQLILVVDTRFQKFALV